VTRVQSALRGTTLRGSGEVVSNPNVGKPWHCRNSPTGAHHWFINGLQERCMCCEVVREVKEEPSLRWSNNQYFPYGRHKGG
jgi:hypothetical protein